MAQPIDAVITWVDGNDPKLRAKQRQHFQMDEKDGVTSASRFVDCNEIFYCIAGILKNLKFISRIFIVTDNQIPPAIEQIREKFGEEAASRITLIDHKIIFEGYEKFLPTFNSPAIETMLHRIPSLSDRYIYFNDDVFVVNPMTEEDFFLDQRPVLRGVWRNTKVTNFNSTQRQRMLEGKFYIYANLFSFKESQAIAFRRLGETEKFFWHDHTPHAFFRPDLETFFSENESFLLDNVTHKIRHRDQFAVVSLANVLDLRKDDSAMRPTSLTCVKPKKLFQRLYVWRKRREARRNQSQFLCVQSLVDTKPKARQAIFDWLDEILFPHEGDSTQYNVK